MAQTGQETILIGGQVTNLGFLAEKNKKLNALQNKLISEGKEIVNIVEAAPISILGVKQQEIRVIWRKPDKVEQSPSTQNRFENVSVSSDNFDAIVERIFMFLEDREWDRADYYCEQALNYNPKSGNLYLGKLMAELKVKKREELKYVSEPFDNNANCIKASRFDSSLAKELKADNDYIYNRKETARKQTIYDSAVSAMSSAKTEKEFRDAYDAFVSITGYRDSNNRAKTCLENTEEIYKNTTYKSAVSKISTLSIPSNEKAIKLFESIIDWKDSRELIEKCNQNIESIKVAEEKLESERNVKAQKAKIRNKKIALIGGPIIAVLIVFLIVLDILIIPSVHYKNAVEAEKTGNIRTAVLEYGKARKYKDNSNLIYNFQRSMHGLISAGDSLTIGLCADGTVVATGSNYYNQDNVGYWNNISDVNTGMTLTVGLYEDGTVIASGDNKYGQCNLSDWKDIVEVYAGDCHAIGLCSNGTVITTGDNSYGELDVKDWKDIVSIAAGPNHTVGLHSNGKVVATGDNEYGQCNVGRWKNIIAVSANISHTVGLCSNGTVVATGDNQYGECNVYSWKDIIAVSAGWDYTIGLCADGTVVSTGYNNKGQCDVLGWKDIVAISAGMDYTIGLRADGTVVSTGNNKYGQCNVDDWKDMKLPTAQQ